ncbi:MAG: hypothetical protein RLN81_16385 [Balneolaceae bacterium]
MKELMIESKNFSKKIDPESSFFHLFEEILNHIKILKEEYFLLSYKLDYPNANLEIENKNDPDDFVLISLSRFSIEFRTKLFEFEQFFDEAGAIDLYKKIVRAFFEGEYKVFAYFKPKGKFAYYDLKWDDSKLSQFNSNNEVYGFFFKVPLSEKYFCNGNILV